MRINDELLLNVVSEFKTSDYLEFDSISKNYLGMKNTKQT